MKGGVCDAKKKKMKLQNVNGAWRQIRNQFQGLLEPNLIFWKCRMEPVLVILEHVPLSIITLNISSKNNPSYSKIPTSCIKILNFLYQLYYNFYLFQLIIIFNNFIHHKKIKNIYNSSKYYFIILFNIKNKLFYIFIY